MEIERHIDELQKVNEILNERLASYNHQLIGKTKEVELLSQENSRLQGLIDEIFGSRSWKLVKLIWAAHLRLSPPNSIQERFLRTIYRSIFPKPPVSRDIFDSDQSETVLTIEVQPVESEEKSNIDGKASQDVVSTVESALSDLKAWLPGLTIPPTISIIVPVYNCLDYTQKCLSSIYMDEYRYSFEVIVVNNASSDGTTEWLEGFALDHHSFHYINNQENLGFSGAVNQGIEASKGKFIVIANNDLIMGKGWLNQLMQAMEKDPTLGIVSPVTNYIGEGPQLDLQAVDITPEFVDVYAAKLSERGKKVLKPPDRLVFFCVMLRRELYDLIGGLSPEYGKGNFEDDDYCLRTRLAGYSLGVVPTAFVFHYGSRTFTEQKISHDAFMDRNRSIFYERVAGFSTNLPIRRNHNRSKVIKVSVIVRTQKRPELLRNALSSLANQTYQDFEVVLVNDGGEDISEVLDRFSSILRINYIHHKEMKGRCRALNSGLDYAAGRYITYLDDDDIVYPTHLELLTAPIITDPNIAVTYTNSNKVLCINDHSTDLVISRLPWPVFHFDPDELLVQNYIPIMSFLHTKNAILDIGKFDETLDVLEDWDFLIRLSQYTPFHHVSRISNEYRFRVGSKLQNSMTQNREKAFNTIKEIYDRYPVYEPKLTQRRDAVLRGVEEQIKALSQISHLDADNLQKNLLILAQISGFELQHLRQGCYRS